MSASLVFISPEPLIIGAIRKCYLSEGISDSRYLFNINEESKEVSPEFVMGEKDKNLVRRIINHGHTSTLEHSLITFDIRITRACLQELSRHRVGVSPSVQSTRYTLRKILNSDGDIDEFIYKTGNQDIDQLTINTLEELRNILICDRTIPNDIGKYGIPEALLIEERISFNFRSFRHFLTLRDADGVLPETRQLAKDMRSLIPDTHTIFIEGV